MTDYKYPDLYLEQAIMVFEQAGFAKGKINLIRKVMKEKMQWAYDAGREEGLSEGIDEAEKAMNLSLDNLRETF